MLNMDISLGRNVATPQQILEVIRPELRAMRCFYRGSIDARREGWLDANEDLELLNDGDEDADTAVFNALRASAMDSVKVWARDMNLVFDGDAVAEFVRQSLCCAMVTKGGEEQLPQDALDY